MKKLLSFFFVFCFLQAPSFAGADEIADMYFSGKNPALSKQEQEALKLAEKWANGDISPVPGIDGSVQFIFGAAQPSILCAVLQITDIELQPGEFVNTIHLGDTARWIVEPALTGSGAAEIQHLVVKPKDVGIETSLMVSTNRRTYHLRLKSSRDEYIPKVSFFYPEEIQARWEAIKSRQSNVARHNSFSDAAVGDEAPRSLADLDFGYKIEGKAPWKPSRVFNDGTRTIIQMPDEMRQTEAPSLLVVRKEGGLFSDDEFVMVNYRLQDNRFIVDGLFDKAILIAGVGGTQDKITITRNRR
jgi:type IV secretion system protein VirB9